MDGTDKVFAVGLACIAVIVAVGLIALVLLAR